MKFKPFLLLLILGVVAIVSGSVVALRPETASIATSSKDGQLTDWLYRSGGVIDVVLTYPKTIQQGVPATVKLAYKANDKLESAISQGLTIDTHLEGIGMVVLPQKRQFETVESGYHAIEWQIQTNKVGFANASLTMDIDDSKTASGLYPINSQLTLDMAIPIETGDGATKQAGVPTNSIVLWAVGAAMITAGLFFRNRELTFETSQASRKQPRYDKRKPKG